MSTAISGAYATYASNCARSASDPLTTVVAVSTARPALPQAIPLALGSPFYILDYLEPKTKSKTGLALVTHSDPTRHQGNSKALAS